MGGLTRWDPTQWTLGRGWGATVGDFLHGVQGRELAEAIQRRLAVGAVVYPPEPFRGLALTPRDAVRVVILGQDPYHGPGQAEGLAFSVPDGVRTPPSLRNILRELARDQGRPWTGGTSLECWARQGVLLLNTHLTVEQGQPASHARLGWERLTDALIADCGQSRRPLAFLLWGAHAQAKAAFIDDTRHLVLRANHPSPLSALRPPVPFIGCGHFGRVNAWLAGRAEKPIDWFCDGSKSMA